MSTTPFDRLNAIGGPVARLRRRFKRGTKTAFIFSGGGNLGAVQVGMLRALTEAGIEPDLIVGCSVGAINGAGFAAEPNINGVERLDRLWRRIADGDPDLMPSRFIPVIAQMARKGESLHDRARLTELLDDELPTKTFAGLKVPFACVATDVETATEYWFEHSRLVPALLASAALPAVYPAFEHRGRSFIDGGVLNEIHAAQAVAMGANELYILHVGHLERRDHEVLRPFDSAVRAYWTARRFRLEEDLRRIPANCIVHRLPAGSNPRLRFDDFSQGPELADLAYDATSEYLKTGHWPEPVSGPVSDPRDDQLDDTEDDHQRSLDDEPDEAHWPDSNGDRRHRRSGRGRSKQAPETPVETAVDPGSETTGPVIGDDDRDISDGENDKDDDRDNNNSDKSRLTENGSVDGEDVVDGDSVGDGAFDTDGAETQPASSGRDQAGDRFARAFSRWGSTSLGRAERPPGWDEGHDET